MTNVTFDEEHVATRQRSVVVSGLTAWVVKRRFVADTAAAEKLLLYVTIACVVCIGVILATTSSGVDELTPKEQQEIRLRIQRGEVPYVP
jgi:hypothetical protein